LAKAIDLLSLLHGLGVAVALSAEHRLLMNVICTGIAFSLWLLFYLLYVRGKPVNKVAPAFQPVTFLVGLFFVLTAIWFGIKFLPGTPTFLGVLILLGIVAFTICYGIKTVRAQWELLNHRKRSR
jgi:ABC-type multidrug transport system permease subunit